MHLSDPKYINNQQLHFNIHALFYSQLSHQHVSAGITAIFRAILLLRELSWKYPAILNISRTGRMALM